jgi:WXG100 family type VII secretion target
MDMIKVKPDVLRTSSTKIKNYEEQLNTIFDNINKILNSMENSWSGKAFFAFQMGFIPLSVKMKKVSKHIEGISKNLNMVADGIEDKDNSLARNIGSAFFLDSLMRRSSNENIVVSGNCTGGHATRQFIEPAIKQIQDWKKQGKTNITWFLANSGYTDEQIKQIKETANNLGVHIMPITDKDDLIDYMNSGEDVNGMVIQDRNCNKISDISVFSHGTVNNGGTLALGFEQNSLLDINTQQLKDAEISGNAFSKDFYTWFASCNIGTIRNNTSFAQEWVNKTGGTEEAVAWGRTEYSDINPIIPTWRAEDWVRRNILHKDFDKDGCVNYPVESKKETEFHTYAKWYKYTKSHSPEKIEKGEPRQ